MRAIFGSQKASGEEQGGLACLNSMRLTFATERLHLSLSAPFCIRKVVSVPLAGGRSVRHFALAKDGMQWMPIGCSHQGLKSCKRRCVKAEGNEIANMKD